MANEKRLIDANNISNGIALYLAENAYLNDTAQGALEMVAKWVNDAPTVDAVEVVRCKDCKHWDKETGWCDHHSHFIGADGEACHPWESIEWKMLDEDDFCSYGESKTDNHD